MTNKFMPYVTKGNEHIYGLQTHVYFLSNPFQIYSSFIVRITSYFLGGLSTRFWSVAVGIRVTRGQVLILGEEVWCAVGVQIHPKGAQWG